MSDYTSSLTAALSHDGSLVAVVVPSSHNPSTSSTSSSSRCILQVYQVESALLQVTLTARVSSTSSSTSSSSTSPRCDRVVFCGNNHVIALFSHDDNRKKTVFIWDLSRGGVVAHTIGNDDDDSTGSSGKSKQYLDAATHGDSVYLLVALGNTTATASKSRKSGSTKGDHDDGDDDDDDDDTGTCKLQVHQYSPTSGQLTRKIKCGKIPTSSISSNDGTGGGFGLALLESTASHKNLQILIRNDNHSRSHGKTKRKSTLEAFRVLDAETGHKIAKHKYPHDNDTSNSHAENDKSSKKKKKKKHQQPVSGTAAIGGGTGIVVVANTIVAIPQLASIALFHLPSNQWIPSIPLTTTATATSACANVTPFPQHSTDDDKIRFLVDQSLLYQCSSSSTTHGGPPPKLMGKINSHSFLSDHSHAKMALLPRSIHQVIAVLHNPKSTNKTSTNGSSLQIQVMDWSRHAENERDDDDDDTKTVDITVGWQTTTTDDDKDDDITRSNRKNKRNAETITVLGPGQGGAESATVSEFASKAKKAKTTGAAASTTTTADDSDKNNDNNNALVTVDEAPGDEEEEEQDPSMGMSIADRLKKLTEVMDDDDDDEDDDDDDNEEDGTQKRKKKQQRGKSANKKSHFVPKRATTESLTQLLTQALQGGDDGLLELALVVKDKAILQETIKGLKSHWIDILVTKLTIRMASKPQRAEELALWLSLVLQSGRVRKVSQLQPLKNLLQERIEAFPHLLRLEGRLAMIKSVSNSKAGSSSSVLTTKV